MAGASVASLLTAARKNRDRLVFFNCLFSHQMFLKNNPTRVKLNLLGKHAQTFFLENCRDQMRVSVWQVSLLKTLLHALPPMIILCKVLVYLDGPMHFGSHPSRSRPWRPPRRTTPGSTLPKKPKQFDFGTRFSIVLEYSPTPPGVVRDGGRDGRPAAQTRSLPILKRPITTPTSSLTLSRKNLHTLF